MNRSPRDALIWPLALIGTVAWLATLLLFALHDDTATLQAFVVTSGLEGIVFGYAFGVSLVRRAGGDQDG